MYNLYLKGISTDNQELEQIRNLFKENELDFTNVFNSYSNLAALSKNSLKAEIDEQIRKCNPTMQNINLICNSVGCNIGSIEAERSNQIKNLILISPEFGEYTPKEKAKLEKENNFPLLKTPFGEEKLKINSDQIRSLIVFNRTNSWATLAIERINIPILIIYSKDDTFIPKEYLHDLNNRKPNVKIKTIDSKLHNPLTSSVHKQQTINIIKNYLK